MPSELETAALRFRRQVLTNERQAANTMVRAYGEAWQRVRADLTALQQQIDAARAQGLIPDTFVPRQPGGPVIPRTPGTFSPSWLYQQERYQTLQRQIEREMRTLAEYADGVVMAGQQEAIQAGLSHSTELATVAGGPDVTAVFNRLPREAVQDLVGFASDGSPLRALFDALGPQVSQGMRDALTTALATGMGPRETARLMRRQFGMGLTRALRISRTETLRAYREAGRRNYETNADVIDGWQWLCACDRRSCASCWAMHGSIHTTKETLDDHPNGRCAMVPIVKGFKPAIKRTGTELFSELPESDQRHVLGPAAHLAYQDGAVQLRDFVGRKNDPQWGTMRYARSLRQILGDDTAKHYTALAQAITRATPRPLGADVSRRAVVQARRLAEVQTMKPDALSALHKAMQSASELPKASQHFLRHKQEFADLGIDSLQAYVSLFQQHIRRSDLRFFTYVSSKPPYHRLWSMVGMDNKVAVLYNEDRKRHWTLMRPPSLELYLDSGKGWWVEVAFGDNRSQVEKW